MRPVAQIWLTDGYIGRVDAFIEKEDDVILRGGLGRCLEAPMHETSIRGPMAVREEQSMVGDQLFP